MMPDEMLPGNPFIVVNDGVVLLIDWLLPWAKLKAEVSGDTAPGKRQPRPRARHLDRHHRMAATRGLRPQSWRTSCGLAVTSQWNCSRRNSIQSIETGSSCRSSARRPIASRQQTPTQVR